MTTRGHDMPFGAKVSDFGVTFTLWAPEARTAEVIVDHAPLARCHRPAMAGIM